MALTVGSYAELATRFPVSAGEAAYVRAAFHSRLASTLTGLVTIVIGIVASATVALGAAGYIAQFIELPQSAIVAWCWPCSARSPPGAFWNWCCSPACSR